MHDVITDIDIDRIHDDQDDPRRPKTVTGQVLFSEGNDSNLILLRETVIKWVLSFIKTDSDVASPFTNKGLHDVHSHTEGKSTTTVQNFKIASLTCRHFQYLF